MEEEMYYKVELGSGNESLERFLSLYRGHRHLDLSNSLKNSNMIKTLVYKDKPRESVKDGLIK